VERGWTLAVERNFRHADSGETGGLHAGADFLAIVVSERHLEERGWIPRKEARDPPVGDPDVRVCLDRIPDVECEFPSRCEHAVDLTIGAVLLRKEHHAELAGD